MIRTKWVFKIKLNDLGVVVTNKARLVAKGFYQLKESNFEEIFSLVVHLEAIRLLLNLSSYKRYKLF